MGSNLTPRLTGPQQSRPRLDPKQCAAEFGLDSNAWATVCERSALFYGQVAFLSSHPADPIQWRDRYALAARQIRNGSKPDDVGIPGVGITFVDMRR